MKTPTWFILPCALTELNYIQSYPNMCVVSFQPFVSRRACVRKGRGFRIRGLVRVVISKWLWMSYLTSRSWGVKGDEACEDSWSEPGTYNWIVPCALFTHINSSVCPRGWERRSKKSSPAVWAIPLHARELGASRAPGQPQNHWPLTGGAFQGMRVVLWLDLCVFFMQHGLQT